MRQATLTLRRIRILRGRDRVLVPDSSVPSVDIAGGQVVSARVRRRLLARCRDASGGSRGLGGLEDVLSHHPEEWTAMEDAVVPLSSLSPSTQRATALGAVAVVVPIAAGVALFLR